MLVKENQNGNRLAGVTFSVYTDDACRNLLTTIVTDEHGVGISEAISIDGSGKRILFVKETALTDEQKPLYELSHTVYPVVVFPNQTVQVNNGKTIINRWTLGQITLTKVNENGTPLNEMDMYSDCLVSDCYAEIMQVFGERIADQSAKAREHYLECKAVEPNLLPLTKDDCTSFTHGSNLEGKIVVIKPDVLRREYQMPTHQIKLCTGGFGSHPNSRGSACFCTDLYSGESSRFERYDILGIMPEEKLPDWAKKGLADIRAKQSEKKKTEAR